MTCRNIPHHRCGLFSVAILPQGHEVNFAIRQVAFQVREYRTRQHNRAKPHILMIKILRMRSFGTFFSRESAAKTRSHYKAVCRFSGQSGERCQMRSSDASLSQQVTNVIAAECVGDSFSKQLPGQLAATFWQSIAQKRGLLGTRSGVGKTAQRFYFFDQFEMSVKAYFW
ncbi:MAG: hypothetical protein R3C26_22590 [Calditrichia bacterium]